MTPATPAPPDGSDLCTQCGLCCTGVVFSGVRLRSEDEVAWARGKKLDVLDTPRGPAFRQPCACLDGTRCSSYETRPTQCRSFECTTFKAYVGGQIALDAARARLDEIVAKKAAIEAAAGVAGDAGAIERLWSEAALLADPEVAESTKLEIERRYPKVAAELYAIRDLVSARIQAF